MKMSISEAALKCSAMPEASAYECKRAIHFKAKSLTQICIYSLFILILH